MDKNKTLLFALMYLVDPNLPPMSIRYNRYLKYFREHYKELASNLVFLDDGSPSVDLELMKLPVFASDVTDCYTKNPSLSFLPEELPEASIVTFPNHLGRPAHFFLGWWRSFLFAPFIAEKYGFEKSVHIESDAYVISDRLIKYIADISTGWTVLWCPRWSFPETGIQVICKDQFEIWKNVVAQQVLPECYLPFTTIEKSFKGDRYGEYLFEAPNDADYICQVEPGCTHTRSLSVGK
jgi:hypothetical protein